MAKAAAAVKAASAEEAELDARKLRSDFPIFQQRFHGKPLAYLDRGDRAEAAAGARRAARVLRDLVHQRPSRVYLLAERATERFEGSREKVRAFINAASTREIVFTTRSAPDTTAVSR